MQPLQPIFIGYDSSGLKTDVKPFLLNENVFSRLENAFCYRKRILKRSGLEFIGRLERILTNIDIGTASTFNLLTLLVNRTGSISAATQANPCQITSTTHRLRVGDTLSIAGVVGMTQLNGNTYTVVTIVDANNFTINVDSTAFTAYVSGGTWTTTVEPNAQLKPGALQITFGANLFTDFSKTGTITNSSKTNPCVITSANHHLTTGDRVTITGIVGMTELNTLTFTITVINANTFSLDYIDATNYTAYVSGGTWSSPNSIGNGIMVSGTTGTIGFVNYITGVLTFPAPAAAVATSVPYFPGLPAMAINNRELATINLEQTIFFDTKYAYLFAGGKFSEFIPGTQWDGLDTDFYWSCNYRGSTDALRLFFVTNFENDINNPMRYYDGTNWNNFQPLTSATRTLYSAKILIPYYGRLLAMNTWEGVTASGQGAASNFFNRCSFSQIGDPTQSNAWQVDILGKGGFIDAPTNEAIISATFFKNTLVVEFERTTWQLRYQGDYGIPFIWERISSDFGSASTYSPVLFNDGILCIGDKGITSTSANGVERIDLDIPDLFFSFRNADSGLQRIHGIRDYQRELVFWNYCYDESQVSTFPSRVLVYNYRNNTFAIFRDNVTCFGILQPIDAGVTWDSLDVTWDDEDVTWDPEEFQSGFPFVMSGNQQGFIHKYGYVTQDQPSLSVQAVNLSASILTIPNHNLETGDIIETTSMIFVDPVTSLPVATDYNNKLFYVVVSGQDAITLFEWNGTSYPIFTTTTPTNAVYVGGGKVTLYPFPIMETKDFNPYQTQGKQVKVSYIDFLTDASVDSAMTVNLIMNTSTFKANIKVGNQEVSTALDPQAPGYYVPDSNMAWHRFYTTQTGQYIKIQMTYDDVLRNMITTYQSDLVLNAMNVWVRVGGKIIF